MYEITVLVRDAQGNIIEDEFGNPKKKSFDSDSSYKIWEFWNRNGPQSKKRKKTKAATAKDAVKIVESLEDYAAKITSQKRGNDESVQTD